MANHKIIPAGAALAILLVAAVIWSIVEGASSAITADSSHTAGLPIEVEVGKTFTIRFPMTNVGEGDRAGISVSFKSMSVRVDIEFPEYSGGPKGEIKIHHPGSEIWHANGTTFASRHLLIESIWSDWSADDTLALTLAITPKSAGRLEFMHRGWVCRGGLYGFDDCFWRGPSSGSVDQQGFFAHRSKIEVVEPAKLSSCRANPNPVSAGQPVDLKARASVPEAASRKRLHVEFELDGGDFATNSYSVRPGYRRTFTREVSAPSSAGSYRLRCHLYAGDDRLDSKRTTLRVVEPPQPPRIVSQNPGAYVNVNAGETMTFEAVAEDRDGDLASERWIAPHSLATHAPHPLSPTSPQTRRFETSFPISGNFRVRAVFTDSRGVSAIADWNVIVEAERPGLESDVIQLARLKASYDACVQAEDAVCRDRLRDIESEVSDLVDSYRSHAAEEVNHNPFTILWLGIACGAVCDEMGRKESEHWLYQVGWLGFGAIPFVDIPLNSRDARESMKKCFGSTQKDCDEVALLLDHVAIIPGVGKVGDVGKIIKHLEKKGLIKYGVDFVQRHYKSLGKAGKKEFLDFLRNSDALFRYFLILEYPNIVVKPPPGKRLDQVDGFADIKKALRESTGRLLGAHRVLKVLELDKYRGYEILAFNSPVRRRGGDDLTDIDVLLRRPDGSLVWVEAHHIKSAEEKAESLLRAYRQFPDGFEGVAASARPGKIHMEVFVDSRDEVADLDSLVLKTRIEGMTGMTKDSVFKVDLHADPPPPSSAQHGTLLVGHRGQGNEESMPTTRPDAPATVAPPSNWQIRVTPGPTPEPDPTPEPTRTLSINELLPSATSTDPLIGVGPLAKRAGDESPPSESAIPFERVSYRGYAAAGAVSGWALAARAPLARRRRALVAERAARPTLGGAGHAGAAARRARMCRRASRRAKYRNARRWSDDAPSAR